MKKISLSFLFLALSVTGFTQTTVKITIDPASGTNSSLTNNIPNDGTFGVPQAVAQLKSFKLEFPSLASGHKLKIFVTGATHTQATPADEYSFAERNSPKTFSFNNNIINSQVTIKENDGTNDVDLIKFRFIQTPGVRFPPATVVTPPLLEPLTDYLNRIIADYNLEPIGWVRKELSGMSQKEKRQQANMTHIFFDEYGNSLLGSMPQGISNRQYIVHIIYKGYSNRQGKVRYSVKQKSGSFNSGLVINNSGALNKLPDNFQGEEVDAFDIWKEELFPMGIATDDLSFDIIATTEGDDGKPVKVVLETQTIKMSPVYHASIDFGLINSRLENATFSLVDAPDGSSNKVVKETDKSPTGIVTVMATFYTSPIVLIEKIMGRRLKKSIPNYKLTGRSFFDDHSFIERIYPTVGVSISSKAFENLFFGLNWEIARGLSIFGGGHWGKVNTFDMPNFIPGETPVTQQEFDFYTNTKWKVDWAYGVKLDITIVTNLFK